MAVFAYDRDDEIQMGTKELPHKLMAALRKMLLAVLARCRDDWKPRVLKSPQLYPSAGVAMYYWARGRSWYDVIKTTGIAEAETWPHWFCAREIICGRSRR